MDIFVVIIHVFYITAFAKISLDKFILVLLSVHVFSFSYLLCNLMLTFMHLVIILLPSPPAWIIFLWVTAFT